MITSSVNHYKLNQARHPRVQTIKRQIPGSNLEISFTIQKVADNKPIVQATIKIVVNKTETKIIPNVPIESFPSNSQTNISFNEALQVLRTNALDYVTGKIIFLPSTACLVDQWNKQKTLNGLEGQEDRKKYINKLKKCGKIIKNPTKHSREVVNAYHLLGKEFLASSKYREALLLFQHMYKKAEELELSDSMSLAKQNLGILYRGLGDDERAISHDTPSNEDARIYFNRGNEYASKGDYEEAIKHYQKYLNLDPEPEFAIGYYSLGGSYVSLHKYVEAEHYFLKSLEIKEGTETLIALGVVYQHQGNYKKALKYFKKALQKASNPSYQYEIFVNLGFLFQSLGRYSEAQEYHQQALDSANKTENIEWKARAYYNLGKLYMDNGNRKVGVEYLDQVIPLLKCLEDHQLLDEIILELSSDYIFHNENTEELIRSYEKQTERYDINGQMLVYTYLARTYLFLKCYGKAIFNFQKAISCAEAIHHKVQQASLHSTLGLTYHDSQDFESAIKHFYNSIYIFSTLQKENCEDSLNWQISFYETQFRPYRLLEKTQLTLNNYEEALLIADSSKAKALVNLIEKRSEFFSGQKLSLEMVKEVSKRLQTIIVVYSCDPFDDETVWCWVISPKNGISHHTLSVTKPLQTMPEFPQDDTQSVRSPIDIELKGEKLQKVVSKWIVEIEKEACRGSENLTTSFLEEQLKEWYKAIVSPIEKLLPKDGERVTFIPDAFLHDLPFALFRDDEGTYLFEKCTLITVPSVATLVRIEDLSKANKFCRKLNDICMVANSELNQEFGLSELEGVKEERTVVARFFETTSELDPIVEEVKKNMSESGHIHVSCHGLADEKENEHSVFEGALVMTDKLLYTENIVDLPLNAELAFLSACSSGKGKVYREGTVGLPFAFLAGGVSSVIATRWQIFDKSTPKIVEEFYKHYRGRSKQAKDALAARKPFGQAEALREAMLFAKKTYPTKPQVWGAFFLTGLPGNIQNDESINRQAEQFANLDPLKVWKEDGENNVCFYLKDEIVITKLFKKNSEKELDDSDRDFPEEKIQVYMTSRSQVKRIGQIQRQVNDLRLEEKRELLESLLRRKIIVKDDKIIICALP